MIEMSITQKELKKLTRRQLLELLITQTERVERLQEKLSTVEKQLENRIILEANAGSIAEASLRLNGIFESAQNAANQYLENIEMLNKNQELLCKQLEEETRLKTKIMIEKTEKKCSQREQKADNHLKMISEKLNDLCHQYPNANTIPKDFFLKWNDENEEQI